MSAQVQYVIDAHGRVWKGKVQYSETRICNCDWYRCNCQNIGEKKTERSIIDDYQIEEDFPLMASPNGIVRFLTLNDKTHWNSSVRVLATNKVVTRNGDIHDLDNNISVGIEGVTFVRVVDLNNGSHYELSTEGDLYRNYSLIRTQVDYLSYMGKSGIIIQQDNQWLFKIHADQVNFQEVIGDLPTGRVISQRVRLIRTTEGCWKLDIRDNIIHSIKINIVAIEGEIIDLQLLRDKIFLLTDLGFIYQGREHGGWVKVNELVLQFIHQADLLTNLYLEDGNPVVTTKSGLMFKFLEGVSQYQKYPQEMFRKPQKMRKSARNKA